MNLSENHLKLMVKSVIDRGNFGELSKYLLKVSRIKGICLWPDDRDLSNIIAVRKFSGRIGIYSNHFEVIIDFSDILL